MKHNEKDWLKDFKEFTQTTHTRVPNELSQKILQNIKDELQPSVWLVFFKISTLHAIIGTLSLGLCDQFGMTPFQTHFSLSDYFMKLGNNMCMLLCGFLFLGLSFWAARLLLKREEFAALGQHAVAFVGSLSVISLLIFFALGTEILFQVAVFWLLGALLGGLTPFFLPKIAKAS